jgi:hypothetical protein
MLGALSKARIWLELAVDSSAATIKGHWGRTATFSGQKGTPGSGRIGHWRRCQREVAGWQS